MCYLRRVLFSGFQKKKSSIIIAMHSDTHDIYRLSKNLCDMFSMISFPPFVLCCRHIYAPIDLYLQSECDFQHVVPPLHGVGLKRQKPCYVCYT
jgi:hypothetical protein